VDRSRKRLYRTDIAVMALLSLSLFFNHKKSHNFVPNLCPRVPRHPSPKSISFCDFISHLKQIVGKAITTGARISAFEHGTSLWDYGCHNLDTDLRFQPSWKSNDATIN
jgi:hypothetical protein